MDDGKSKMRTERLDETWLVKYLLGNLSEAEEAQVEDRAFSDTDYLNALDAVETDLIDAYVHGGLSQSERRAFERRFLTSPNRWRKVEFATALAKVASESTNTHLPTTWHFLTGLIRGWAPALQLAAAAAVLVCIVGPSWLIFQNAAMHSRMATMESQQHELESHEQGLRRQLAEAQNRAGTPATQHRQQLATSTTSPAASLVFLAGPSRAETPVEQLVLTPSTKIAHIEVQLEAKDEYPRFSAQLRTRRGEEVLTWGKLLRNRTSTGYGVSFDVPASVLSVGEYELALKGVSDQQGVVQIGYYYFGVRVR